MMKSKPPVARGVMTSISLASFILGVTAEQRVLLS